MRFIQFISTLTCSLGVLLCLTACDDDVSNPINSNNLEPTPPASEVVIDSVDTDSLCPWQHITIYGSKFPSNKFMIDVTIGDKRAVVIQSTSKYLTVAVPADIQHGRISIIRQGKTATALYELPLGSQCDDSPPVFVEITSVEKTTICAGEKLRVNGANFTAFPDLRYMIGNELAEVTTMEDSYIEIVAPANIGNGRLTVLNADGTLLLDPRISFELSSTCASEYYFKIEGLRVLVERSEAMYSPSGGVISDTVKTGWQTWEIEFDPTNTANGEYDVKFSADGDSVFILNQDIISYWDPAALSTTTKNAKVLIITFNPGSTSVHSVTYQQSYSYRTGRVPRTDETESRSSRSVHMIVNKDNNGELQLGASDICSELIAESSSRYVTRSAFHPTHDNSSKSIDTDCTDGLRLTLRYVKP